MTCSYQYSAEQIEKNELGGACNMCRGEERCMQGFTWEIWSKETNWQTQAQMDHIKIDFKDMKFGAVDWIDVAED